MRPLKSLLVDLALIALATMLALLLRENLEVSPSRFVALVPYLLMTLVAGALILPLMGLNKTLWRFSGMAEYWRLVAACIVIVLAAVAIGFASNRMDNVSRSVPILQSLLIIALLVGTRLGMRAHRFRRSLRKAAASQQAADTTMPGAGAEAVLVVGLNTVAELFLQAVAESGAGRISIAGVIGRVERQTGQLFRSHRILGVPEEIDSIVREMGVHGVSIDRIVVTVAFDQLSPSARQALLDVENGTRIRVDYFAERLGFEERRPVPAAGSLQQDASSAFVVDGDGEERQIHEALKKPYWAVKRWSDVAISLLAILATAPLMLAISVVTVFTIGLPMLFWQQRPGRNGQPFKVYKFRSLLGAHDENGERLADALRETPFGRFLRLSRLDELPQLFNILAGHMSLVGPRPLLNVDQLSQFRARLLVRPGLTGWAQVNGGKSVSASDKMALDMWYIRNASLALDVKIAWLTVKMVLFGERTNPLAVEQALLEIKDGR